MKNSFNFLTNLLTSVLIGIIILFALSMNSSGVKAQVPDEVSDSEIVLPKAQLPVLKINGEKNSSEVYLQSLDIQVEISGNIASTRFTMSFKNRTNRALEGELLFPLPDGVTVSAYALDINGKMRDAVPVEKAKATQVFEEIEQRRIDPGLLERVEGNNFRTRIYPIPSNGTRTISIEYEEELPVEKNAYYYRLPMDYKEAIENFSVKATVWKSDVKPKIQENLSEELQFDKQGENLVASFARKNYQAERSLVFSMPAPVEVPQILMQSASGSYYFIASCLPKAETRKKQWGNRIGIIWDASLSGQHRNITKELEVLDKIISDKKDLEISLYLLNNQLNKKETFSIRNGDWSALRQMLESVVYDGGTDFSTIRLKNISSDEFLFFSDGLSTLSDADFVASCPDFSEHPVHCIVSSPKADYSAMKWIAAQTNGKFINLNSLSQSALEKELTYETLHFLGIESNGNVKEVYPSVSTPVNGSFSIAGIAETEQTTLTLLFGYGNRPEQRIQVKLDAKNATKQGNVYRIWAQKKINELDMRYEQNKQELTELGQQFGIVTRNTSLIVLETLQDYITYNIVPPAELQADYFRWKKGQEDELRRMQQNFLNAAIASAKDLQQWWNTYFTPVKNKYPQPDKEDIDLADRAEENSVEEIMVTQQELIERKADISVAAYNRVTDVDLRERRVEEANKEISGNATKISQPKIQITPIKQDKEYLNQLTGKAEADYTLYLKLRPDYIGTPDFYFDMADWFFRLNDREKALRILTCIADMDLENASLYRLLSYRLKEYKMYALEAYICEKVIQWRPFEPQSYRDYALALADNRNYQAALDSLYSVLTQSYASNINMQSAGIEEVAVTEINRLIDQNKTLNTSAIDKKIIKAMPVDIRVVINWNMNNTDIDLHVKDPRGETCFYGHSRTEIGGRISRDITQGYGPEQFMLKKAISGKYEVFVNYFGDSQVKAEGPSTIMIEIYTSYSDKKEQCQVVCVQLSKEKKSNGEGLLKIAEFKF
ncbi:MAG: DUF2135 domain-containing protein [Candidatus Azobacteroides sp.]|nr:DUF2135 domain-containing protein [Candidatus Azobacteroides sp.]